MSEIPDDIIKAAEMALDNLLCYCKASLGSYEAVRQASIKEIATAIFAERERGQWQPIETAPKDGSAILTAHEGGAFDAWWEPDGRETSDGRPGWIDGTMNRYEEYITYEPTHWMPLPAPPKGGDA